MVYRRTGCISTYTHINYRNCTGACLLSMPQITQTSVQEHVYWGINKLEKPITYRHNQYSTSIRRCACITPRCYRLLYMALQGWAGGSVLVKNDLNTAIGCGSHCICIVEGGGGSFETPRACCLKPLGGTERVSELDIEFEEVLKEKLPADPWLKPPPLALRLGPFLWRETDSTINSIRTKDIKEVRVQCSVLARYRSSKHIKKVQNAGLWISGGAVHRNTWLLTH